VGVVGVADSSSCWLSKPLALIFGCAVVHYTLNISCDEQAGIVSGLPILTDIFFFGLLRFCGISVGWFALCEKGVHGKRLFKKCRLGFSLPLRTFAWDLYRNARKLSIGSVLSSTLK
jgi:hypothetical protein